MPKKLRTGALISGGGTNLQAVIDACEKGEIGAEIVCVGSDNPEAKGLERARRHQIPWFVVDYARIIGDLEKNPDTPLPAGADMEAIMARSRLFEEKPVDDRQTFFFRSRMLAEARLLAELHQYKIDLLILAGFMRMLTPYFIDHINADNPLPRIMNIHPALLPAFPGADGYGDTFRYGCKVGGCTVHFVDYGEDSGPVIGQRAFPVLPEDTLESVRQKGLALEWVLYPECIGLYAAGRLRLETGSGRRTVRILPAA